MPWGSQRAQPLVPLGFRVSLLQIQQKDILTAAYLAPIFFIVVTHTLLLVTAQATPHKSRQSHDT